MSRLRRLVVGTGVGGAAAVAVVVGLGLPSADDGSGTGADPAPADVTPAPATAAVERRDLVEREELEGTLGFGATRALSLGGQGTITALAAEGSVVERGGALGEVDGRPVPLLYGARPMWRSIGEGADTADGADIAQLEENLIALGYGTAANLGPNETWSQATTAAVKRWQEALGVEETGRVDLGAAVFAPGPVRIAAHTAEVGSPGGSPALTVTGTERLVEVALAANRQGMLSPDQAVDVELPDGTVVAGTVRSIATTVTPGDEAAGTGATVAVVIVLTDPAAAGALDEAPVTVQVVTVAAEAALAVPVEALLALAEGGYAVERPDGSLVAVELGAFADGYVQVTPANGELAEGDDVVVPS